MRYVWLLILLTAFVCFPRLAHGDSIDFQGAGSLSAGTAVQFGSVRPGHVWEVMTTLVEIDNLTTGMIERGMLGTIDITSGTLFSCGANLCFHGGTLDIDAPNNSSIFDSQFSGGTITVVDGITTLNAHFGSRVAAALIRNGGGEFSSQALTRTSGPTVPEPSSYLLLGSGVLGLGLLGKRHCFGR